MIFISIPDTLIVSFKLIYCTLSTKNLIFIRRLRSRKFFTFGHRILHQLFEPCPLIKIIGFKGWPISRFCANKIGSDVNSSYIWNVVIGIIVFITNLL
jgi:hypothetical protein